MMVQSINVETNIGQALDSMTTYSVAGLTFLMSTMMDNSNEIMVVGGFVLLLLRLYVDGSKAYRTFRRNKETK